MDPNAVLEELRFAVSDYIIASDNDSADAEHDAAARMADCAEALDEWMSKGGFLPAEWAVGR